MKNPKLILQILNLLNGALLSIYLIKILGWTVLFNPVKLIHIIIAAFIIYGLKSWVEVKTNTKDPIRTNKFVSAVFFAGSALFIAGVVFKMMHWPYSTIMLIAGVFVTCSSFVFSFFAPEDGATSNDDILDDF